MHKTADWNSVDDAVAAGEALKAGTFEQCREMIGRFPALRSEIKVLPVKPQMAHVQNVIVTLKNRALSPVAQLFIDCAREVAKPLAKRMIDVMSDSGTFETWRPALTMSVSRGGPEVVG
jgi:hypothetical protein